MAENTLAENLQIKTNKDENACLNNLWHTDKKESD